ncbi:MAG: hypothetical protein H3C47_16805 [Candidatus Cloacimonetes bacterium]|nr:hypothetical protein [Candidatus Cloacimonadota bacterium]
MQYKNKFIAFIDILGFKNMVTKSEEGSGMSLDELLQLLKELEGSQGCFGSVCPCSKKIESNLDYCVTQISDCVIMSVEKSPAGLINLIQRCFQVVFRLLKSGLLCRGYLTEGKIYHTRHQVIGTGYQKALSGEKSTIVFKFEDESCGTPFVEIDPEVCRYIQLETDDCVRKQFETMCVKSSEQGDGYAIFPFKQLSRFLSINPKDTEGSKRTALNVRKAVLALKDTVRGNGVSNDPKVQNKIRHYTEELDKQIRFCDSFPETIDDQLAPFPYHPKQ